MAEFRDNTRLCDEILKEYIPRTQEITDCLLQVAAAKEESNDFQSGMLSGLMTCQSFMIPFHYPELSEKEVRKVARHIADHLCQHPKIKDLFGDKS